MGIWGPPEREEEYVGLAQDRLLSERLNAVRVEYIACSNYGIDEHDVVVVPERGFGGSTEVFRSRSNSEQKFFASLDSAIFNLNRIRS